MDPNTYGTINFGSYNSRENIRVKVIAQKDMKIRILLISTSSYVKCKKSIKDL